MSVRLAYLVTHPIQYQAPLLARIAREPDISLTVFFQSSLSVSDYRDEGFGREIAWDTPLLEGYEHRFLPTFGDERRLGTFRPWPRGFGAALHAGRFDALWIHGYARPFHLLAARTAKRQGLKILLRDEVWDRGMRRRPGLRQRVRRAVVAQWLALTDAWLAIGSANADHYRGWGVPDARIFPVPYAVDNAAFAARAAAARPHRAALRAELGIGARPAILFSGKLIARKRPLDAVRAMAGLHGPAAARRPVLLIAGDGPLRGAVEAEVAARGLGDDVRLLGFRNQSELPALYDLAEVLAIPSEAEPWGLVVNEAMAAGTAVVATEEVGAAHDLVRDGQTGFVVPVGDTGALAAALSDALSDPERAAELGRAAAARVADWDFEADVRGLRAALGLPRRLP
jgi:glycosyltransferase involved in cell wall biosynthesis